MGTPSLVENWREWVWKVSAIGSVALTVLAFSKCTSGSQACNHPVVPGRNRFAGARILQLRGVQLDHAPCWDQQPQRFFSGSRAGHLARPYRTSPGAASGVFGRVKVVDVFVTVRDKNGSIVKDLVKEDFALSEDGRAQVIRYFSRESDLPLTMGLLVDTTPSESNMLEEERRTSRAFLKHMLRPGKDKAFLIQYSNEVELLRT
jgi:hypothetical protein